MDFTEGFRAQDRVAVAVAGRQAPHGFIADDFGSLVGFEIDLDLIGSVDLVVGEDSVLEDEPAAAPAFSVVDPLLQDAGDGVADEVVEEVVVVEGSGCESGFGRGPVSGGGGFGRGRRERRRHRLRRRDGREEKRVWARSSRRVGSNKWRWIR